MREEWNKVLLQLIIALTSGGTGNSMPESERKQLLENLQKMMEKPIVIERSSNESDTNYMLQVNPSSQQKKAPSLRQMKSDTSIKESLSIRESI
jgi:hypothetical protein